MSTAEAERPPRVLLVEDDGALRQLWASLLAGRGLDVAEAGDAVEAVEVAARLRPELALLDLGLPPHPGDARAGLAAMQHLLLDFPRLKVIIITGQDEPSLCWRAIGMGAFDYLVKPAAAAQVLQAVERARMFVSSERALAREGHARLTVTAPLGEGVREFGDAAQERLVRSVMEDCGHNVTEAARRLGLSRENLYYFLRKFGVERGT